MANEKKQARLADFERYAEGRHHFLALSMILSAVSAILTVVPFYYIWLITKEVLSGGNTDLMVGYGWMSMLYAVLSILLYVVSLAVSHLAAFRISKNMKRALVAHTLTLSPGAFDDEGSGRIRRTIQDSVESTHEYLAHSLPDLAGMFVLPFAAIALLLVFDWRLGLAALVPIVIGLLLMMSLTGKKAMQESMSQWLSLMGDANSKTVEYVRGISVVKVFQQTLESFQNLKRSIEAFSEYCRNYTVMTKIPRILFFVMINSCGAFVVIFAVLIIEYLESGVVTADMISNVIFYVVFTPVVSVLLMRIVFTSDQTYRVNEAIGAVNSILAMKALEEPAAPVKPSDYSISFNNLTFSYSEDSAPAVDGVDLVMKQGTVTALVGASGSGKSTLAGLAARYWDPQKGSVSIGGVDLKQMGTDNIRAAESYVFQNNHLIKGTLLENVRLGRPDAGPEEVSEALRLTQCADIVAKMPDGLNTRIGPGGTYLSGGEVQRISVARAILRDTPIVILDEATAFADPENEHLMQKAFEELARGRTVLMIAHRLTTVRNADLICVMDQGRIVESGTHEELMASSGRYRTMWDDYQKTLSWKVKGVAA